MRAQVAPGGTLDGGQEGGGSKSSFNTYIYTYFSVFSIAGRSYDAGHEGKSGLGKGEDAGHI